MATFSVAAIVLEPAEVLQRFADYYRRAGAEEVLLLNDGPLAAGLRVEGEGVRLIATDDAFYGRLGAERPEGFTKRQWLLYPEAVRMCRSDWLLIVDADEFVHPAERIGDVLGQVPDSVASLAMPVAEAVFGPGDDASVPYGATHFRRVMRDRHWLVMQHLVYGRLRKAFRKGVLGHIQGKQAIRIEKASGLEIRAHRALRDGKQVSTLIEDALGHAPLEVLHFDAVSLPHWTKKWQARAERRTVMAGMTETRRAQLAAAQAAFAAGGDAPERLMHQMYGLTARQTRLLDFGNWVLRARPFAGGKIGAPQRQQETT